MRKRNASLAAAYATLDSIFNKYRNNIKEAFGEEVDRRARYGIKQEVVEEVEVDENGKEKVVKKTVEVVDDLGYSEYARFFDETCEAFSKDDPEYNKHFITCVNSWANTILETRGYLFLNEVYERLGLNKSLAGQTVGWIYDKERPGKVDFGVYSGKTLAARRFINGYEPVILLDFNVDGDIMANDKLKLYFANGF